MTKEERFARDYKKRAQRIVPNSKKEIKPSPSYLPLHPDLFSLDEVLPSYFLFFLLSFFLSLSPPLSPLSSLSSLISLLSSLSSHLSSPLLSFSLLVPLPFSIPSYFHPYLSSFSWIILLLWIINNIAEVLWCWIPGGNQVKWWIKIKINIGRGHSQGVCF